MGCEELARLMHKAARSVHKPGPGDPQSIASVRGVSPPFVVAPFPQRFCGVI